MATRAANRALAPTLPASTLPAARAAASGAPHRTGATDMDTATATRNAAELARQQGLNPLDYLRARGYVQDVTDADALAAAFAAGPVTVYVGYDPTAPSLH